MQVLTVSDVAALLDCTPDTVRSLAREGTLPGFKPGRDWIFPVGALMTRLDEIATAEARSRREPRMASAVLHQVPTRKRSRPPELPKMPQMPQMLP